MKWKHPVSIALGVLILVAGLNWVIQAVRKPSEVLFPFDGFTKSRRETWEAYGPLFREHATDAVPAELLAALAQAESAGNPVARTYWRWRLAWNPIEVYKPASSAVGLYQITDGRFAEAQRLCIHHNRAVDEGPWYNPRTCWFNAFYFRVVPTHAVELTAAFLDRKISSVKATPAQRHDLAAVIHLCGATAGEAFARRGFRPLPGQRCGEHDLRAYLSRVNALKHEFRKLSNH
ncbi:MAG: transglycosylase SLT domain-containing protein [Betaproteobacteria bacterium]